MKIKKVNTLYTLSGSGLIDADKSTYLVCEYEEGEKKSLEKFIKNMKLYDGPIKDMNIHRLPNINFPRDKMNLLKESHNINIKRNAKDADLILVNLERLSKQYTQDYYNHYQAKDIETDVKVIIGSDPNFNDDDYIQCPNYRVRSKLREGTKRVYSYRLKNSLNEDLLQDMMKNPNKYIDVSTVHKILSAQMHTLTDEEFYEMETAIKSSNLIDRQVAVNMLANCNYEESFDRIAYLLYFYGENIHVVKHDVHIKSLIQRFDKYYSGNYHYNSSNAHGFGRLIENLHDDNKLTMMILKETIKQLKENVIKSAGLSGEGDYVFKLDTIKVNPEIIKGINERSKKSQREGVLQ